MFIRARHELDMEGRHREIWEWETQTSSDEQFTDVSGYSQIKNTNNL
jgi:hypothetical protein